MASKQPLDFATCCRACLQVKKDMRPLFEQLTATMLMGITNIQVEIGDGLPTQLCLQCVYQVSRCHSFKEMVKRNDVTLKETLKQQLETAAGAQKKTEKEEILENKPLLYAEISEGPPDLIIKSEIYLENEHLEESQEIERASIETATVAPKEKEADDQEKNDIDSDEERYLKMVKFTASSSDTTGKHTCSLCFKEFRYARWLKQHVRSHSNWIKANCKKPPTCNLCNRTFKAESWLQMHMRTHEERPAKEPTCTICQSTFPTRNILYRHRLTHFDPKPQRKQHWCTICDKRFSTAYTLRCHQARHRGEMPHVCKVCSKTFYHPDELRVHYRMHTGEKPLKCKECDKEFRRHSTLYRHMKQHKGVRKHVCDVCSKAFFEVFQLTAHMRMHTGEKPFACSFCDKKFSQQSSLLYHRRTHTGEKPYACKICDARFLTASRRNGHQITHNNKASVDGRAKRESVACAHCGQEFGSAAYLALHRRYIHDAKLECRQCGQEFKEVAAFKKHARACSASARESESGKESGKDSDSAEDDVKPDDGQDHQSYPVISSVQSLRQQETQQLNAPQHLQVASSCQSVLPNIVQVYPDTLALKQEICDTEPTTLQSPPHAGVYLDH